MQLAEFKAFCPFEIGDTIIVFEKERTITDIACTHLLKSGNIHFSLQFNNQPYWNSFNTVDLQKLIRITGNVPKLGTSEEGGNNGI